MNDDHKGTTMNWRDAMVLSGTHTEYALSDLLNGHHVDFTAEDLQTLVNAVVKRCAEDTAQRLAVVKRCAEDTAQRLAMMQRATTATDGRPFERRVRRGWWRVLRAVIDLAALYCAWAIQFAASGSYGAAFITATAVSLYGLWCFYDGSA